MHGREEDNDTWTGAEPEAAASLSAIAANSGSVSQLGVIGRKARGVGGGLRLRNPSETDRKSKPGLRGETWYLGKGERTMSIN